MRNRGAHGNAATNLEAQEDLDYLDIPAFLRNQAD